jgi:hypothetical protein
MHACMQIGYAIQVTCNGLPGDCCMYHSNRHVWRRLHVGQGGSYNLALTWNNEVRKLENQSVHERRGTGDNENVKEKRQKRDKKQHACIGYAHVMCNQLPCQLSFNDQGCLYFRVKWIVSAVAYHISNSLGFFDYSHIIASTVALLKCICFLDP